MSIYRKRENMGLVLRKYIVGTRTHFGQKKLLLPFSQVDLGFEARWARLGTGLFNRLWWCLFQIVHRLIRNNVRWLDHWMSPSL